MEALKCLNEENVLLNAEMEFDGMKWEMLCESY
jgi:hypothetical protein